MKALVAAKTFLPNCNDKRDSSSIYLLYISLFSGDRLAPLRAKPSYVFSSSLVSSASSFIIFWLSYICLTR